MRFIISFLLMLLLLQFAFAFDSTKVYSPLREIDRTLSFPAKLWNLTPGIIVGPKFQQNNISSYVDVYFFRLDFPYYEIGDKAEIHTVMPYFKYYLSKNVEVSDKTLLLNGFNFDLFIGIFDVWWTPYDKFGVSINLGYELKNKLSNFLWITHTSSGMIKSNMQWGVNTTIGCGFQITDNFSVLLKLMGNVNEFRVYYADTKALFMKTLNYRILVPIDMKVNFTKTRSMLFRIGVDSEFNEYDKILVTKIPIGFQYTWSW